MKKRTIAVLIVITGLAWLLGASAERLQNRLTVENRSGQLLTLRVTTGGETITLRDVAAGAEGGYVTNGMSGHAARFVVSPGGKVEFTQSDWICPY